jgi:hypothetical protein
VFALAGDITPRNIPVAVADKPVTNLKKDLLAIFLTIFVICRPILPSDLTDFEY